MAVPGAQGRAAAAADLDRASGMTAACRTATSLLSWARRASSAWKSSSTPRRPGTGTW